MCQDIKKGDVEFSERFKRKHKGKWLVVAKTFVQRGGRLYPFIRISNRHYTLPIHSDPIGRIDWRKSALIYGRSEVHGGVLHGKLFVEDSPLYTTREEAEGNVRIPPRKSSWGELDILVAIDDVFLMSPRRRRRDVWEVTFFEFEVPYTTIDKLGLIID